MLLLIPVFLSKYFISTSIAKEPCRGETLKTEDSRKETLLSTSPGRDFAMDWCHTGRVWWVLCLLVGDEWFDFTMESILLRQAPQGCTSITLSIMMTLLAGRNRKVAAARIPLRNSRTLLLNTEELCQTCFEPAATNLESAFLRFVVNNLELMSTVRRHR